MPLETREDIVRFITGADARGPHHFKQDEYLRPYALNEFADIYQVNGAILPLWRSGVGVHSPEGAGYAFAKDGR